MKQGKRMKRVWGWSLKKEELLEKEAFEQSEPDIHVCTEEVAKQRELQVQLLRQKFALVCLNKSKKTRASRAD